LIFFRRKEKKEEVKEVTTPSGTPIGKAILIDVFGFFRSPFTGRPKVIVLGLCLTEGVIFENSVLKLLNGKLLRAVKLEHKFKKVPMAKAPDCIGVQVEGIGWKADKEELLKYRRSIIEVYKS